MTRTDRYIRIDTGDGTYSLLDRELDEAMHSRSGAYDEALRKHVLPSRALEVPRATARVLDIGFGLGYNILALICERALRAPSLRLEIVTIERDAEIFPHLADVRFGDDRDAVYDNIRTLANRGIADGPGYTAILRLGDARQTIRHVDGAPFDAVFLDPYSPAKNPELWTVDFFLLLRALVRDEAIITTYSSAPQVREALCEAGFRVGPGPSVGGKREGTLATVSGPIPELTAEELELLRDDPRSTPYRDPGLHNTREMIRAGRRDEMRSRRAVKKDRQAP